MSKIIDLLFHGHRIASDDVARIRRVLLSNARGEAAALKALEIQLKVHEAVAHRGGRPNGT